MLTPVSMVEEQDYFKQKGARDSSFQSPVQNDEDVVSSVAI